MNDSGTGVAPHRRLLVRLLVGALVVAAASITATAWLATQTTTDAIRRAEGESVSTTARIYDQLDAYAARHRSWRGVGPLLARIDRKSGRRVYVTSRDRRPFPGTPRPTTALPNVASAVVDPLQVDTLPVKGAGKTGIDPRALGPFRLNAAQRREAGTVTRRIAACANPRFQDPAVAATGGRPTIELPIIGFSSRGVAAQLDAKILAECGGGSLVQPTTMQARALSRLNQKANACLARAGGVGRVKIDLRVDLDSIPTDFRDCVLTAWRAVVRPWIAPPALLFNLTPTGDAGPLDLSGENRSRVVLVAVLVLGLAVALSAFFAARLTRPLRRLTEAVRTGDESPVPITTRDEIGQLTDGFNKLTARRLQLEDQRRDMVRDIAHELRGPISNMRSWLEAAEDELVPRDAALCSSLLDETLQLQHIVADLADLAAADAGMLSLHPEPLAVAELVEQCVAAHRAAAEAAEIGVDVRVDGDPTVHGDPVRLRQALGNVLTNAIRYSEPGGEVEITAREEQGLIEIRVRDTGCGIAPEDVPRAFDRFWRADPSRRRATGGSGLGLPIARKLVEAHGGQISLQSEPREGTTVTLTLPAPGETVSTGSIGSVPS